MTGFEVPGLGALVTAIKFLLESIGRQIEITAEKRKQWFKEHIEPSYKQLVEIHEDYTKSFSIALDSIQNNRNLKEVVQLLKAERPNRLLHRQEVIENLLALKNYRMDRKRKPKILVIFYDYVSSVDDYLNAASPIPRETWYSYFIDMFSELVERGADPLAYDYGGCAQGEDAPRLSMEQLSLAIHENRPKALQKIQENYAKLRTQCLSKI